MTKAELHSRIHTSHICFVGGSSDKQESKIVLPEIKLRPLILVKWYCGTSSTGMKQIDVQIWQSGCPWMHALC